MNVRLFAMVTGPDGVNPLESASEYDDFAWNVSQGEVEKFMNERHPDAVYAVITRRRS